MKEYLIPVGSLIAIAIVSLHYYRKHKSRRSDKMIFMTHNPQAYHPGNVHEATIITRIVQVEPTALVNGGRAPCWYVYGRPNTK